MPKISIVLAIYNVEEYLKDCLNSLINQTFSDIEFICINDGSTDNSLKILEEYAQKDNRFVIVSQLNQGPGVARNEGVKIAKGEYTMFVDPDDWIETNACEILYNKLTETKADVIQFNFKQYYDSVKKTKFVSNEKRMKKEYCITVHNDSYINCEELCKKDFKALFMAVWNRIYKTEFLRKNNIMCSPATCAEDNLFVISLMFLAKKIYFIDNYLYTYRIRRGSLVNRYTDKNFDVFENIKLIKSFLINIGQFDKVQTTYRNYLTEGLYWHSLRVTPKSRKKYTLMCKDLLTEKEFKTYKKNSKTGMNLSFCEFIFSIKNMYIGFEKYKTLTILGLKFKIKKQAE